MYIERVKLAPHSHPPPPRAPSIGWFHYFLQKAQNKKGAHHSGCLDTKTQKKHPFRLTSTCSSRHTATTCFELITLRVWVQASLPPSQKKAVHAVQASSAEQG